MTDGSTCPKCREEDADAGLLLFAAVFMPSEDSTEVCEFGRLTCTIQLPTRGAQLPAWRHEEVPLELQCSMTKFMLLEDLMGAVDSTLLR